MLGGGAFGSLRGRKVVKLNDIAGSDKFQVKDSDGAPVFTVDSQGNYSFRGKLKRV